MTDPGEVLKNKTTKTSDLTEKSSFRKCEELTKIFLEKYLRGYFINNYHTQISVGLPDDLEKTQDFSRL